MKKWILCLNLVLIATGLLFFRNLEFQTDVKIIRSGDRFSLEIESQKIEAVIPSGTINSISIKATPSSVPMGGKSIDTTTTSGQFYFSPLPKRFSFKNSDYDPTGDWWVDGRLQPEIVWEKPIPLSGDFELKATFTGRCTSETRIILNATNSASFSFRRGFINNDFYIFDQNNKMLAHSSITPTAMDSAVNIISPFLFASCLGSFLLVLSYACYRWQGTPPLLFLKFIAWVQKRERLILKIIVALQLSVGLFVAYFVLHAMPHFQDDFCYLLRAKWLCAGSFSSLAPIFPDLFDAPFTLVQGERLMTIFPVNWPIFLSVGEWLKMPWVVSPICGALMVLFLLRLGKVLGLGTASWLAVILSLTAIMGQIMSASMMTHAACSLLLVMTVLFLIESEKTGSLYKALFAGLSLGFTFGMRPLTAASIGIALGLYALVQGLRGQWTKPLKTWSGCVLGGVLGALPSLLDNWVSNGTPWSFAYQTAHGYTWTWSNLAETLLITDSTMAAIPALGFGWGHWVWPLPLVGYSLAIIPFLSGKYNRYDILLLLVFSSVVLGYSGINLSGAHGYGPRYYYDVFFCLYLLIARGCLVLIHLPHFKENSKSFKVVTPVFYSLLILGTVIFISAVTSLPEKVKAYTGYNGVTWDLSRSFKKEEVKKAVIVLKNASYLEWIQASRLMPWDWQSDVIVVRDGGNLSRLLLEYPDRPVYQWEMGKLSLIMDSNVKKPKF